MTLWGAPTPVLLHMQHRILEGVGIERWDSSWDAHLEVLNRVKIRRLNDSGYFVTDAERQNAGVFRVQDMSTLVLCTDEVKRFIETEAFTNIESLEVGETT